MVDVTGRGILYKMEFELEKGFSHPLGATFYETGVNFSLFAGNATSVELLIFEQDGDMEPIQVIEFDPVYNRTFSFWHIFIKGLKSGMQYAYRVDGPYEPERGMRFNRRKVLVDPYAKGNSDTLWDRARACDEEDNLDASMRSVLIDIHDYDWEGDQPLNRPSEDTIIYEMHVRGFTNSKTSGVDKKGTFLGVIEKIPYLQELGITAIELLPVFEFDDKEIIRNSPNGEALKNYWGYSTVGYFAPVASYCVNADLGTHIQEFRDMVKALHKAGIEVILDVVFNHTDEGNHMGPTINFRGFDNLVYYYLATENKHYYTDYTGCGNTLNVNHPIVEKFILDCLEFWVNDMHVDGFRFDEGSVLSRGEHGGPIEHPPVLWSIELSESLAKTKLITEAWDAAGLYQIGSFPGYRWSEWNGRYRDDVRRFVRGDYGVIADVATRIAGSSDLYDHDRHSPLNSINFITCHDGFTLMDLVSYNEKHNWANGENNQDGITENISYNHGVEGETSHQEIQSLRMKQIKNFISLLMISQGVPMILAGDELGRTQQGNNNAYCQDNEISWIDWSLLDKNQELFQHFRKMISLRKSVSSLRRTVFYDGSINVRGLKDISWHGCILDSPGWNDPLSRVLAFTIASFHDHEPDVHVIANMGDESLEFEVPLLSPNYEWVIFSDTSDSSLENIAITEIYLAAPRSVVILLSKQAIV